MDEQTQPDEQVSEATIFKLDNYVDVDGRNMTVKTPCGPGEVAYIGHVTGQVPINQRQVANIPHHFQIEADSIRHAFERFDEVAEKTWPVAAKAAMAEMQSRAQQQSRPRIAVAGSPVPVELVGANGGRIQ